MLCIHTNCTDAAKIVVTTLVNMHRCETLSCFIEYLKQNVSVIERYYCMTSHSHIHVGDCEINNLLYDNYEEVEPQGNEY